MTRRSRPLIVALLVPLLAALASCSSDSNDDEGAAPSTDTTAQTGELCPDPGISTADLDLSAPGVAAEGEAVEFTADPELKGQKVVLYSGRDEELIQPLIDQFEQLTGAEVEVRYGSSAEMAAQIMEEGDASPADVFYSQEVGAVGALAKDGRLSTIPDEIVERVQPRFQPDDEHQWVGVTGRSRVIVYNPELVDDVPQCVAVLTEEAYKDDVAIVPGNAGFQAFVTGFRVSEGEEAAEKWLQDMQANGVNTTFEKNGEVLEAVNSGEIPIGLINHYYWARHEDRDNLTAQLVFPTGDDPGGLVNATAVGITAKGEQNPAAVALVDYLTSKQGQEYFVAETWEYPVVAGVAGPQGLPPLADLGGPAIDLTDLDSLEQTQALLSKLGLDVS